MKQITLTEKQIRGMAMLADPDAPLVLFSGGARSGKTFSIVRFLVNRAFQYPGSAQLVARFRLKDCFNSVHDQTFKPYLADYVPHNEYKWIKREEVLLFANGSYIRFDGLDQRERVDAILSTEWLTVYVCEITQIDFHTMTLLLTRLSQRVKHGETGQIGVNKFVGDCNPKFLRHWVYESMVRDPPVDPTTNPPKVLDEGMRFKVLHWTSYDNQANLSQRYLDLLSALPAVKRARMRDGQWRDMEGAVYNDFDEDVHILKRYNLPGGTIPSTWQRIRGIDFGFTHPFCCLWGALDPDGRLYIYDEWYERQLIVADHAEEINRRSEGTKFRFSVADWDSEDRETLDRAGIKTVKAQKQILPGIELVKRRMKVLADGRPRLYILEDAAPNLVSEMYMYKWARDDEQATKEEPLDMYNHALDALRYMVTRLDRRMADVMIDGPGQMVPDSLQHLELTPDEITECGLTRHRRRITF